MYDPWGYPSPQWGEEQFVIYSITIYNIFDRKFLYWERYFEPDQIGWDGGDLTERDVTDLTNKVKT